MNPELKQLRAARTRAATTVKRIVAHMLRAEAPFVAPDGLPSWWPFWSDCLYDRVRECVRAARLVERAEKEARQ